MAAIVLGLDLSLRGLGLVAVPTNWACNDWSRVARCSLGIDLPKGATQRELVARRRALAEQVAIWASRRNARHVFVEAYPMGGRIFNVDKLAELGGVVKDRLADIGLVAEPVAEVSARKLLLGKLPARGRKQAVGDVLRELGADFDDADQADAFCVANYGLAELGAPFVSISKG